MSNNIIKALIAGRLADAGLVTFDRNRKAYFAEFNDGHVGVLSQSAKVAVYTYFEYAVVDGKLRQSTLKNPHLSVGLSVNEFFKSVVKNNAAISEVGENPDVLDPNYIVKVHGYDPKTKTAEELDLTKYVFEKPSILLLQKAQGFAEAIAIKASIKDRVADLTARLSDFIKTTLTVNQMNNLNVYTENGALVLDLKTKLDEQGIIIVLMNKLFSDCQQYQLAIPSLTEVVAEALKVTDYKLNRVVDFTITPYIYLIPSSFQFDVRLPAVPPEDESVRLNT